MVDPVTLRRAGFRTLFVAVAFAFVFVRILPFMGPSGGWPAPDLIVILAFAWILRRPEYLPLWLVAIVVLFADVIFMRPLGVWALATVLGTEFLRRRSHTTLEQPFPVEWFRIASVLLVMHAGEALILAVTLVPQPGLGATLLEYLTTVAFYPLAVVATAFVFGVRPPSPNERDAEART
ncbi:rod shape-determining protein MreD [Palleronia sp.]|uniref:rod shape-determining protein MreD n=1 Tax=Palleronia sp. TaxID=1940284 RepID=UPI0035C84F31